MYLRLTRFSWSARLVPKCSLLEFKSSTGQNDLSPYRRARRIFAFRLRLGPQDPRPEAEDPLHPRLGGSVSGRALIPSPGVDYGRVRQCIDIANSGDSAGIYSLINLFSGGALLQMSIFAIGIMPYITASIIVQLLTVVIPKFEELRKEGQSGQAKMTQYTRYLSIALAILQSTGIVALAARGQLLQGCDDIIADKSIFGLVIIVLVMTAGAAMVMWFGEVITERGVGNGMSLLIFAGIASRIPSEGKAILDSRGPLVFAFVCLAALLIIAGVVFVEQGQRRIPVQYAKRMVGRKMYGGSSTYLPLKVNQAGVIPVIFASSLLYLPNLIAQLTSASTAVDPSWWQRLINTYLVNPANPVYIAIYFGLIVFFTYFYVAITFNPEERADEMKKFGGFIPGIRPGQPTADYLNYVLSRITLPGAIYLGTIAVLPTCSSTSGMAAARRTCRSVEPRC